MFYSLSASLCDIMTEVGALNPSSAWVNSGYVTNCNFRQNLGEIIEYLPVVLGAFCSRSLTANKTALNQLLLKS